MELGDRQDSAQTSVSDHLFSPGKIWWRPNQPTYFFTPNEPWTNEQTNCTVSLFWLSRGLIALADSDRTRRSLWWRNEKIWLPMRDNRCRGIDSVWPFTSLRNCNFLLITYRSKVGDHHIYIDQAGGPDVIDSVLSLIVRLPPSSTTTPQPISVPTKILYQLFCWYA